MRSAERARFAGYELDFRSGDLRRPDGTRTLLPDQPFRILTVLIRARGSVVSRDALQRELWPDDTFVDFEHSLNAGVKRLRELIGDSATAPRFIETLPKRGYRFVAPVEIVAEPAIFDAPPAAPADGPDTMRRGPSPWQVPIALAAIGICGIAATLWLTSRMRAPETLATGARLIRVTTDAGLTTDPALSADGSLLAYSSDRSGQTGLDIWVQPTVGGTARRLTADAGDETEPDFSPDGSLIVYAARERGGICVVGTLGGVSRQIASASRAHTPRFSPDGTWIAYWSGLPPWKGILAPVAASGEISLVPSAGGSPRVLDVGGIAARYPLWSPDGRRLLFLGERVLEGRSQEDWFTVAPEGGPAVETGALPVLRAAGITGVPIPGGWTRDGRVVFSVIGDDSNIWQVPVAAATGKVSGNPTRLTFGSAHERDPAISRSGAVAFASVTQTVGVWRIALDPETRLGRGSFERVTSDAAADRLMNVTSDGARLLFVSQRTRRDEAWIRDLRTGDERQLTFSGVLSARMAPDGGLVAINKDNPTEVGEIVSVTGGTPRPLCEACEVIEWSPDGSRVLFGRGNPRRIVMRDVKSGHDTELLADRRFSVFQPRFSPAGDWIVFHTAEAPAIRHVYVAPANRNGPVPASEWIPVVTGFGIQPGWSADGAAIYYFSLRDGFFCPWVQPLDPETHRANGQPQAVAHLHRPQLRAADGAAVTNDVRGGFLYATLTETTGNIWLLRP